ncbi:predicted protein [Coccidioides posadasii C735 delta SOWgp]|uniref:Uncharacterized protein n=1 Tax=Coccidioides posadasii (strain C735) TaxID=222929 RepID=C5PEU2_COCP7|nr:predicted protein [Coccidioides posadasii C735 delta SOWgp]EER23160.1 predicted protein [Coccidioides posadasii C735 delta SOWgp]|eukprot:XP_003065305.1 predicted protein [Coccidioides posadasii C735 delta SOWgp]
MHSPVLSMNDISRAFIYRFCGVFLTPRKDDVIPSPDAARCFMRNLSAADREIDVDYYEYPDGFLNLPGMKPLVKVTEGITGRASVSSVTVRRVAYISVPGIHLVRCTSGLIGLRDNRWKNIIFAFFTTVIQESYLKPGWEEIVYKDDKPSNSGLINFVLRNDMWTGSDHLVLIVFIGSPPSDDANER